METTTLTIKRFRDKEGNPTCARNFQTGEVCQFFTTTRFGSIEMCGYLNDAEHIDEVLERRNGSLGYLIPSRTCPLWNLNQRGL